MRRTAPVAAGMVLVIGLATGGQAVEPIKLSHGQSFSDVGGFEISPDGRQVVFTCDAEVDYAQELFVVPSAGGAVRRLCGALVAGSRVSKFKISPSGNVVVYAADEVVYRQDFLYAAPLDGGESNLLSDSHEPYDIIDVIKISPDGVWVAFVAEDRDDGDAPGGLYTVRVSGESPALLLAQVRPGGSGLDNEFWFASGGSRVVYRSRALSGDDHLYSVPVGGGPVTHLTASLTGWSVDSFRPKPNGDRVAFIADHPTLSRGELFTVHATGGSVNSLSSSLGSEDRVIKPQFSPDGSRIVFRFQSNSDEPFNLFSIPDVGGPSVMLNDPLDSGRRISTVMISPDSNRVVYTADQDTYQVEELYSVPINGGTVVKLNGGLTEGGGVEGQVTITPDSQWVVYVADQVYDEWPFGYRVPIAGPEGSDEVMWAVPVDRYWRNGKNFLIDPSVSNLIVEGHKALFDSVHRLWLVPLVAAPVPQFFELVPVSAFDPDGDVSLVTIGPEGTIVYRADQEEDGRLELFAIPPPFKDGFESGGTLAWSSSVP